MTWTYGGDPTANDRDNVRHLVGDTDTNDQLLTDEEIAAELASYSNAYHAAVHCIDRILTRLARRIDRGGLGVSGTRSQMFQHYKDLRQQLAASAATAGGNGPIHFGGVERDEALDLDEDTDLEQPVFSVGMDSIDNDRRRLNKDGDWSRDC